MSKKKIKLKESDILQLLKNGNFMFLYGRFYGKSALSQVMAEMLEYKRLEKRLGMDLVTFVDKCSVSVKDLIS